MAVRFRGRARFRTGTTRNQWQKRTSGLLQSGHRNYDLALAQFKQAFKIDSECAETHGPATVTLPPLWKDADPDIRLREVRVCGCVVVYAFSSQ